MINTEHFKEMLSKECNLLESELRTLGRKNPDRAGDWEAIRKDDNAKAEDGDVAEEIEEYEKNNAILGQLEIKLNDVKSALSKIEKGTFGLCEVCGEEIEEDRLEANPSAKTCKAHMN